MQPFTGLLSMIPTNTVIIPAICQISSVTYFDKNLKALLLLQETSEKIFYSENIGNPSEKNLYTLYQIISRIFFGVKIGFRNGWLKDLTLNKENLHWLLAVIIWNKH